MDQPPQISNKTLAPSRLLTFGRRVFRRVLWRAGLSAVLEVPGRRTGKPARVTLAPWEVDGTRYVMSQYGVTQWVRNLRAAGRCQLQYKDRTETFAATEVDGDERDRVLAAFRAKADKLLSRDFDRLPNAEDHPTFRLEPTR